jgi:hypothetical protein
MTQKLDLTSRAPNLRLFIMMQYTKKTKHHKPVKMFTTLPTMRIDHQKKKETKISSQDFEQNTNIQPLEKLSHQTGKSKINLPNKNKIIHSLNTNFKTSLVDKVITPQQKLPVVENNDITSPTKKENIVSIPGSEQNTKPQTSKFCLKQITC